MAFSEAVEITRENFKVVESLTCHGGHNFVPVFLK